MTAANSRFDTVMARHTDPDTSHEAARAVKPGGKELQDAIRWAFRYGDDEQTAEDIAETVWRAFGKRWLRPTVVTACNPKRSGLVVVGHTTNERGRRVQLLSLP